MPRTAQGHCVRSRERWEQGCQGGRARPQAVLRRVSGPSARSITTAGKHGTDRMTWERQGGQGSTKDWTRSKAVIGEKRHGRVREP